MSTDAPTDRSISLDGRLMVSIDRAAFFLDVTPRTIRHLIDTQQLTAKKLGRELRISVASLRKLAGD
jgi:hypothetical protein